MQYPPLSRRPTRYRFQSEVTQAHGVELPLLGKFNDEFGDQQCERIFTIHQLQCAQRLFKRYTKSFGILRRERVIALDNVANGYSSNPKPQTNPAKIKSYKIKS